MRKYGICALISALFWIYPQWSHAEALVKPEPVRVSIAGATLDVIVDRSVMNFDSEPGMPIDRRVELLRQLLDIYFSTHAKAPRYSFAFGHYQPLNERIASLASCSSQWNPDRARMNGHQPLADWLRKLLDDNLAYRELTPAFEDVSYRIRIGSIESVLLCRRNEIDWNAAPRNCSRPISASARFPCGALITFELTSLR